MDEQKITPKNIELMEKAKMIYLSSIDGNGYPQTRCIFNLRNREQFPGLAGFFKNLENDYTVYIGTNTSSDKVNQIKINPMVSVYYCIPEIFHGLLIAGKAEFIEDQGIKETLWQDGWEMYYPAGVNDPDYTVLRIIPEFVKGWYDVGKFEFKL